MAARCVIGMLTGRDVDDMVAPLVALGFTEFHCCAPWSPRAVPASVVADAVRRHGGVAFEHPNGTAALAHARERSTDEDLIVVAEASTSSPRCVVRCSTFLRDTSRETVRLMRRG